MNELDLVIRGQGHRVSLYLHAVESRADRESSGASLPPRALADSAVYNRDSAAFNHGESAAYSRDSAAYIHGDSAVYSGDSASGFAAGASPPDARP